VTGVIENAVVRLYATDGSVDGAAIYSTDNDWTEFGITWITKPARTSGILEDKGVTAIGE